MMLAGACIWLCPAAESTLANGVAFDPTKAEKSEDGGILLGGGKQAKKEDNSTTGILNGLGDNEVFLQVEDVDTLKWGLVKAQLDATDTALPMANQMDDESEFSAKESLFQIRFQNLISEYIKHALYAVEARKAGIVIEPGEYEKVREDSRKYFKSLGKAGEKCLALMSAPESYYEHNLTNGLLSLAYAERIVRPTLNIADETVQKVVDAQRTWNNRAVATNECKRVLIGEILAKVRPVAEGVEAMDFGEAAEKWSEDDTSETKGVFYDDDETVQKITDGDVRYELEEAYGKLADGQISDVVETPYSWHILKLLKRNPETEEDEASVELAHIMLEKIPLRPELTFEQAKEALSNAMLGYELGKRFPELMDKANLKCAIPLRDGEGGARSPKIQIRKIN